VLAVRKETENAVSINTDNRATYYFLDEDLATFQTSFFFRKSSPLNEIIKRKIDQLLQSGIIQKFEEERLKALKRSRKEDNEEIAEILTTDHLGICFIAITICWAFSFVVFLLECASGWFFKRVFVQEREVLHVLG
jgi:hypothetical protein